MRILFTNAGLRNHAGTELWVRDVALALQRRSHEVAAYSTVLGEVADELRDGGVVVVDRLEALPWEPEIIHGHHHAETMTALVHFGGVPAIYVCHGVAPWQEAPPSAPSSPALRRGQRNGAGHGSPAPRGAAGADLRDAQLRRSRPVPAPRRPAGSAPPGAALQQPGHPGVHLPRGRRGMPPRRPRTGCRGPRHGKPHRPAGGAPRRVRPGVRHGPGRAGGHGLRDGGDRLRRRRHGPSGRRRGNSIGCGG